ncbi:unnamed protein product, partial [Effrenium voratum]
MQSFYPPRRGGPEKGAPEEVWRAVSQIPRGCVTSYGQISSLLGAPWTPRLVGQALKKNPFAPEVPCHRVVRADRTLGGYFGATAFEDEKVQTKVRLLEEEGVLLERKGEAWLVRAGCFWSFPSAASAQAGEGVSLYPAKRKAEG